MKRFAFVAALALSTLALSACGNAEKEKAMQTQIDSCTKDKASSDAKVMELQAKVDTMMKEMEAAKATPAPTPEPTKGGKPGAKATPTPKAAATSAAVATPAAAASPKPQIRDIGPGTKGPGTRVPK